MSTSNMTISSIAKLQLDLTTLSYYDKGVDGKTSIALTDAVRKFQKDAKIAVDGQAGPITQGKLKEAIGNKIQMLVLHCSATKEGQPVTADAIVKYHMSPTGRGWSRPGYSDIIELDGKLVNVRAYDNDDIITDWEVTNGMLTFFNRNARHVCYIGGVDKNGKTKDTRTPAQLKTMESYIKNHIERFPNIVIIGHNAIQNKGCPSFDTAKYLRSIGVNEKNIGSFRIW